MSNALCAVPGAGFPDKTPRGTAAGAGVVQRISILRQRMENRKIEQNFMGVRLS